MAVAAVCALALPMLVGVAPVGASTPHANFVNDVHREAPSTKSISNKKLAALGGFICDTLGHGGSISVEFGILAEPSNTFHLDHEEIVRVVTAAVYDICPRHKKALATYLAGNPSTSAHSTPHPTTTTTLLPTAFFLCSGSAPEGVDITYGTDTSNINGGSSLPFQKYLPVTPNVQYFYVSAQLQGSDGSITCMTIVDVNGTRVTETGTATGNNIANAQVCSDLSGGWQGC